MFTFAAYKLKNLGVAIATAITVAQLKLGTNGPGVVLRHSLTQDGSVTSTQIRGGLIRKSAAATVTAAVAGTTLNKQNPVSPTTDASLGVSATGITATAEGTDADQLSTRGFNVLNGMEVVYTPEERDVIAQGGIIAQKLLTLFNSTWSSELVYMELRGG
jgi:hypothetical protein